MPAGQLKRPEFGNREGLHVSEIDLVASKQEPVCMRKVLPFNRFDRLVAVEEIVHVLDRHVARCDVHNKRPTRATFVKMWQPAMERGGMPEDHVPFPHNTRYRYKAFSFRRSFQFCVICLEQRAG